MCKLCPIIVIAAALATATAAQEPENRAPVLLRGGKLFTPVGTTCTGIAPEVSLKVSLNERGRVTEVQVLDIQPPSDLDEVFRRATVDKVKTWRFSPAIVDGEAVPVELDWKVQYLLKEGFVPNPAVRSTADTVFQVEDAAQRRAAISMLPFEERRKLLECYNKVVTKLVQGRELQRFDSSRFIVLSDSPNEGVTRVVAQNLEATWNVLSGIYEPAMELQESRLKFIVYVFHSAETFRRAVVKLGASSPWQSGLYMPPGFFLFHLEVRSSEELLNVLLHEGFHGFADRRLIRPGANLPLWLEEGFAEYLANSRIKKGQLLPGKTLKRKFVLMPFWGVVKATTEEGWTVKRLHKAIADDREIHVAELLEAEPRTFFGRDRWLSYPTSWLFVHFLRHAGKDEVADERFASLALYLAEGYPAAEALETVYGESVESIDKRFRRYVGRF